MTEILLVILLSCPSSFGHCIVLSFFFWSLHCLVLLLVIALSCPSSFGHCIVLPFFWSLHCLVRPKEGQDNAMTKRRRTRQCNDQKKDKTMQWSKEEGQDNRMTKRRTRQWSLYCLVLLLLVIALSCPSFGHCIVLSFFFGQDNTMTKRRRTRQ
jgi:hypothetical protein